jgi:hypothetical protein
MSWDKEQPLVTLPGHRRKEAEVRRSRATRTRRDLDCPVKDQKTTSPWTGVARERRSTEPDKACQPQPREQEMRPCASSWRGPAEAYAADRGDSSPPELSHRYRVRRRTARGYPLATYATHLPNFRVSND